MAALIAFLPQLIALIPSISSGVGSVIAFIASIRSAAQQTGEWTPALEKQFVDALIAKGSTDAWKTDLEVKAGPPA